MTEIYTDRLTVEDKAARLKGWGTPDQQRCADLLLALLNERDALAGAALRAPVSEQEQYAFESLKLGLYADALEDANARATELEKALEDQAAKLNDMAVTNHVPAMVRDSLLTRVAEIGSVLSRIAKEEKP